MIPELGTFALAVSCGLAILLMVIPVIGLQTHRPAMVKSVKPLACFLFLLVLFASLILVYCLVVNDFSVKYIAQNSNSHLPVYYRIAAAWGAHEGSLLLWSFLLCCWTLGVALSPRKVDEKATAYVLAVMGFVNLGFLLFIVFTSNPFARTLPYIPIDGQDLNPLLQDIGLIFHPPLLYMGYVGFSVAFAFSIAALFCGRFDTRWIRWFRPWVLLAWIFLTLGILLGSYWAYRELGWGGWWFWDPVENSSLMPWLTGTALLHSLSVAEKRGNFKIWTLLLSIITFSLCLIGTFLVRSGILVSVHAFSSDPSRGLFILFYLVLVIGGSLLLFALRGGKIKNNLQGNALFSKESFLIAGNILLLTAMLVVLLGTLWPLVYKQMGLGSISIGAPFFNNMFSWLLLPFSILLGITPLMRWQADDFKRFVRPLLATIFISIVLALLFAFAFSEQVYFGHIRTLFMVFWIMILSFYAFCPGRNDKLSFFTKVKSMSAGFWGMLFAHIGVAMIIFGACFSHYDLVERNVRMTVGDILYIGKYHFVFKEIQTLDGPNYHGAVGRFDVTVNGRLEKALFPEKRIYRTSRMAMTEAAVSTSLMRDLYVALGEELKPNIWSVRFYYKPFMCWIWMGGLFMAMGGFWAMLNKRHQIRKQDKKPANAALEAEEMGII